MFQLCIDGFLEILAVNDAVVELGFGCISTLLCILSASCAFNLRYASQTASTDWPGDAEKAKRGKPCRHAVDLVHTSKD